jgi:hypothetical protein
MDIQRMYSPVNNIASYQDALGATKGDGLNGMMAGMFGYDDMHHAERDAYMAHPNLSE